MRRVASFLFALVLVACSGGGGSGGGPRDVEISWTPNRETAVNAPGGGYRVYYATTSGFDLAAAPVVDVPYQGTVPTPTSAVIRLSSGIHYIKIIAYSALNPGGSLASDESEVVVP